MTDDRTGTPTRTGFLASVLGWLRTGYPEGVPPTDYFPLLALLRPKLTDQELDGIVEDLTTSGHLPADRAAIAAAVQRVTDQVPDADSISRVSARLAAAGWPLADAGNPAETGAQRPSVLQSVVDWLRKGYPEGVPPTDYIPLVALLRRRLTDDEVRWVADEVLREGGGVPDIAVLITKVTDEMPSDTDIARVQARLDATV
ncbi:DUF3349 domain-containing protein [Nakamurella alba]|uniref:DUF3349 domain-containing protein n=1 Tax=Nakamurella alba TaxID=2665158 RepID=UPI002AC34784|nr:DUF3349 domain-containing protein [Nakamurella alba]